MVVRKAAVRARSFSSAALPRGPFGVSAETAMHFCGAFFRWSIMVVRKAAVRARSFSSAALPRGPFGVSAETAMHFCGAFFR